MLNFFQQHGNPFAKLSNWHRQPVRNLSLAVDALAAYGITLEVLGRLKTFLKTEDSRELYHANPRRIADRLQLKEQQTLRLLVFALKEGIVTLNWDIRCDRCGGVDFNVKGLGELHTHYTLSWLSSIGADGCRSRCTSDFQH